MLNRGDKHEKSSGCVKHGRTSDVLGGSSECTMGVCTVHQESTASVHDTMGNACTEVLQGCNVCQW